MFIAIPLCFPSSSSLLRLVLMPILSGKNLKNSHLNQLVQRQFSTLKIEISSLFFCFIYLMSSSSSLHCSDLCVTPNTLSSSRESSVALKRENGEGSGERKWKSLIKVQQEWPSSTQKNYQNFSFLFFAFIPLAKKFPEEPSTLSTLDQSILIASSSCAALPLNPFNLSCPRSSASAS